MKLKPDDPGPDANVLRQRAELKGQGLDAIETILVLDVVDHAIAAIDTGRPADARRYLAKLNRAET